jgi:hypothetical protein
VLDPDPSFGFRAFDLSQSQFIESANLLGNALSFNVTSTVTPPVGSTNYIVVSSTNAQGSTTTSPVALAGVGGSPCAGSNVPGCISYATPIVDPQVGGTPYFFAAPFTISSSPTLVAVYPKDVCTSFPLSPASGGAQAQGCITDPTDATDKTVGVQSPTGTASNLILTFQLVTLTVANNNQVPNPLPTPLDSTTINVKFEDNGRLQAASGAVNCPAVPIPYQPGDGQITVDTSSFAVQFQPTPTGYAPITATVLVGKSGSDLNSPTTGSGLAFSPVTAQPLNYPSGYTIFGRTGTASGENVTGFTNIQASSDPADSYDIGFLVRDAAGMVYTPAKNTTATAPPTPLDACVLIGVQTSAIQGFLSKSSCFIATAAFRSIEASPVAMLRRFRDSILLHSDLGTSFVHWYYHWSPPAAEWLMRHPQVRYPVLEALVPVEVAAWFMLHPVQLTLLFVFALSSLVSGIVFALVMRAKKRARQ